MVHISSEKVESFCRESLFGFFSADRNKLLVKRTFVRMVSVTMLFAARDKLNFVAAATKLRSAERKPILVPSFVRKSLVRSKERTKQELSGKCILQGVLDPLLLSFASS